MKNSQALLNRFKPILFAIVPIVVLIVIIHLFFYKFDDAVIFPFLISAVIFIFGQVIFMIGIDTALVPMGEYIGDSAGKMKHFAVILAFGFLFGLLSTIAEPDLQIFTTQLTAIGFAIPKLYILFGTGFGVGIFVAIALYRIVSKIPLNFILFASYFVIFILAIFVPESTFAIALDAGVTATGIVNSPFLLALGMGVAKVKKSSSKDSREDNFGLISMASIGSIMAILILSLVFKGGAATSMVVETQHLPLWLETLKSVSMSLIPLIAMFFIYELVFVKIPKREVIKLLIASLITFVGFYMFSFSIEYGFVGISKAFGQFLFKADIKILTYVLCSLFAFFVCFSEPSIKVLADQVEKITNGNIKSMVVIVTIGLAVMLAIVLTILRIFYGISIWVYTLTFFGIAFVLSFFVPKTFTAIAFDSAGVASGSLAIAFLFPIMLGLASDVSAASGFGVVTLIGLTPIVVVQMLGLMYNIVAKVELKRDQKLLIRFSRTTDKYSNIEELEKRHYKLIKKGETYES